MRRGQGTEEPAGTGATTDSDESAAGAVAFSGPWEKGHAFTLRPPRWEYEVVNIAVKGDMQNVLDNLTAKMNEMGAEGWEAFGQEVLQHHVGQTGLGGDTQQSTSLLVRVWFKRMMFGGEADDENQPVGGGE